MKKRQLKKGFTLIELLMVIIIITVIIVVIIFAVGKPGSKSRDAKRKAEMTSLQESLELYYDTNKHYPIALVEKEYIKLESVGNTVATDIAPYIAEKLEDPFYHIDNKYAYQYTSINGTSGYAGAGYKACALLETPPDTFHCVTSSTLGESIAPPTLGGGGLTSFQKTISGAGYDYDGKIVQTSDGGYVTGGGTTSFGAGSHDILLAKFDTDGNLSWVKTIGGSSEEHSYVKVIQTFPDNGYVVVGETWSFGEGDEDILVTKLDSSGNFSWAKTIGGPNKESVPGIIQTLDGGYMVVNNTMSFGAGNIDILLTKIDSSGNFSWAKTIGGTNQESLNPTTSITQTLDGGYVITGYTASFGAGQYDMLLIKLDSSGNLSWAKTIGGAGDDYGWSTIQTSLDNGYFVIGNTNGFNKDMLLVKLDSSGNFSWAKTTTEIKGLSVVQISENDYIVLGSSGFAFIPTLTKLDSSGNFFWTKTIGETEHSNSIYQTSPDKGYILSGGGITLTKLDAEGNMGSCPLVGVITPTFIDTFPTVAPQTPTVSAQTPTVSAQTPNITTQCSN